MDESDEDDGMDDKDWVGTRHRIETKGSPLKLVAGKNPSTGMKEFMKKAKELIETGTDEMGVENKRGATMI